MGAVHSPLREAMDAAAGAADAKVNEAEAAVAAAQARLDQTVAAAAALPLPDAAAPHSDESTSRAAAVRTVSTLCLHARFILAATHAVRDAHVRARDALTAAVDFCEAEASVATSGGDIAAAAAAAFGAASHAHVPARSVPCPDAGSVLETTELAILDAHDRARRATETWPVAPPPVTLTYSMSNYARWRGWMGLQAGLRGCAAALTTDPPAADGMERRIAINVARNLRRLLAAAVEPVLLGLVQDPASVPATMANLARRAPPTANLIDALIEDARGIVIGRADAPAFLEAHAVISADIVALDSAHHAAQPAAQLQRLLAGVEAVPGLSFLQELYHDCTTITAVQVAHAEGVIRRRAPAAATTTVRGVEATGSSRSRAAGQGGTCPNHGHWVRHTAAGCRGAQRAGNSDTRRAGRRTRGA
jgi:hypothetical protein